MMDNLRWIKDIVELLPFHKVDKYQVTNLTFDLIAIGMSVVFAIKTENDIIGGLVMCFVISLSCLCVFWVCPR